MKRLTTPGSTRSALVAAALVAVTGGALFGAIQISRSTANSATSLHIADQAIRAATIVRGHLALATSGSEEQKEVSIREAAMALNALEEALDDLEARGEEFSDQVETGRRFADLAASALPGASTSPPDQETLELAFRDAVATFDRLRARLVGEIELAGSRYGMIGILLGIATAGLAPLVMMLWARSVAKKTIELKELSNRLDQEARIRDARSAVLRTVVHEFRTPLTGISGLAAVLEDPAVRHSSEAPEMIEMIRKEAEDLAHLTDDILTSARLDAEQLEMHPEHIDIRTTVDQIVSMMDRRGIDIDVDCAPGVVVADPVRLRQILRNLVSNAVKYGGSTIGMEGTTEDGAYQLSVVDNGGGVPEAIESRLFQPFPHEGTDSGSHLSVGLGLAISHQLAQAMDGSLSYRRSRDRTVFTVSLPMARLHIADLTTDSRFEVAG